MRTPEEIAAQTLARQLRYRQKLQANGGRILTVALTAEGGAALDRLTAARGMTQIAVINDALVRLAELYREDGPDR